MEHRLYEAAVEGCVTSLLQLLGEDKLVLDRVMVNSFNETPLHVAALRGHTGFVREVVARKPELAGERDSRGQSPLHLASANGHVETVKALLLANSEMCLADDCEGRNPLHLAAMKGRIGVVKDLVQARFSAARATVVQEDGGTILHLCVQHNQFEALKLLLEIMSADDEFVNSKDRHGNTILHLAVADRQLETIEYLLSRTRLDVNSMNANGLTALDVLAQSRRHVRDWDIGNCLIEAGGIRARAITSSPTNNFGIATIGFNPNMPSSLQLGQNSPPPKNRKDLRNDLNQSEWLTKKRDALMVVASLIATMAFQAGMSPPGGVWQDDSSQPPTPHRAGEAVMAYNYPDSYPYFLRVNTICFVASLSTILLLISGLPFKRKTFMWLLTVIMWLAVTSMAVTYAICIVVVTPKKDRRPLTRVIEVAVVAWCGVMGLLLLGHTFRLFGRKIWLQRKSLNVT